MVASFHTLISRILSIPAGQVERTIGLLGDCLLYTSDAADE